MFRIRCGASRGRVTSSYLASRSLPDGAERHGAPSTVEARRPGACRTIRSEAFRPTPSDCRARLSRVRAGKVADKARPPSREPARRRPGSSAGGRRRREVPWRRGVCGRVCSSTRRRSFGAGGAPERMLLAGGAHQGVARHRLERAVLRGVPFSRRRSPAGRGRYLRAWFERSLETAVTAPLS